MKHQAKKERKAAKRIEQTGIVGELNLSETDLLYMDKILLFFTLNLHRQFHSDAHYLNFDNSIIQMKQAHLVELTQKVRRLTNHIRNCYGKTPDDIAKLNIQKELAREVAIATGIPEPTLPFGPQPVGKTPQESVEEALDVTPASIR